jgi:hypothetical protein
MPELTRRYVVMPLATDAPFDAGDRDGAFVLKPWKDPAALRALAAYRDNCYPELARDLDAWIRAVEAGPKVRGDVGRRNESHVRAGTPHARGSGVKRGHAPRKSGTRHPAKPRRKRRR